MLSSISSDFNRSNQASWLGTAFLLATCTFTPLYGRLSNVLGRRGANHVALFFAALGTLLCGLSTSLEMLVAARFVRLLSLNFLPWRPDLPARGVDRRARCGWDIHDLDVRRALELGCVG